MDPHPTLLTIGHSTRSADDFLALLAEHAARLLVDVRRFPHSRRHPHFDREALAERLAAAGIAYIHEPRLGGRRKPRPDSPNTALRHRAFRAYADHMASPEFRAALGRLLELARVRRPVIACAEAVPWRCHRWLLADAAVAGGAGVVHILGPGSSRGHALNPLARVEPDGSVRYPAAPGPQAALFE